LQRRVADSRRPRTRAVRPSEHPKRYDSVRHRRSGHPLGAGWRHHARAHRVRVYLPNFNAQVTYSTKPGQAQLSVGLFQPSNLGSFTYDFTSIPRVEAEFTYNQKSGKSNYMLWVGGLWQS